jgi:hypothetical protein
MLLHPLPKPVPAILALLSAMACTALASALMLFAGDSLLVQFLLLSVAQAALALALLAVAALAWISFGRLKRQAARRRLAQRASLRP